MQSEGGAAGALHGALQGGALATTFTASQGLLLMIPNMYKIAGELTSAVLHVAARSLAAQGLSIFGDHSDVMAVRQTGLRAARVGLGAGGARPGAGGAGRDARDAGAVRALLRRLSHLARAEHDRAALRRRPAGARPRGAGPRAPRPGAVPGAAVHPRNRPEPRCLLPGARDGQPVLRPRPGGRAGRDGRARRAHRPPLPAGRLQRASRSRAGASRDGLGRRDRARDGRLPAGPGRASRRRAGAAVPAVPGARRWSTALPASVRARRRARPDQGAGLARRAAVPRRARGAQRGARRRRARADAERDRRPLRAVLEGVHARHGRRRVRGARRRAAASGGSRSASTTTSPARASPTTPSLDIEPPETVRAVFFGLGSDGTVGANKNTIKILGAEESLHAQGYFVYDSKKSGSQTVSHLRFGPRPIRAPYLISQASFVGCHQFGLLERAEVLDRAAPGRDAAAQLPTPAGRRLGRARAPGPGADPRQADRAVRDRRRQDRARCRPRRAYQHGAADVLLRDLGRARARAGDRADQGVDREDLRQARRRGRASATRRRSTARSSGLHRVELPEQRDGRRASRRRSFPRTRPEFVRTVTAAMMAGRGDELPVSALPVDGTYPSGTTQYEKRNISELVAAWDSELCIQCGNCSFVCPHSVIRSRYYEPSPLAGRAGRLPLGAAQRARGCPRHALHAAGLRRGLHRLRAVRRGLPGLGARTTRSTRRSTSTAREPLLGRRAGEHRVLRAAAGRPTARGSTSAPSAARSSSSRCSSSPAPARAAARRRT